jgi:hypothetical protein
MKNCRVLKSLETLLGLHNNWIHRELHLIIKYKTEEKKKSWMQLLNKYRKQQHIWTGQHKRYVIIDSYKHLVELEFLRQYCCLADCTVAVRLALTLATPSFSSATSKQNKHCLTIVRIGLNSPVGDPISSVQSLLERELSSLYKRH